MNGPPQPVPAGILKQVIYQAAQVAVENQPGGNRVMIITTPFEQLVFPMSSEAAEEIGKALTAPSVHLAGANGLL